MAPLTLGSEGNIYGTTLHGGSGGWGTLFEIDGAGQEKVIFAFDKTNGSYPDSPITFGPDGDIYTSSMGGPGNRNFGYGWLFKLTPEANGTWSQTIIDEFLHHHADGEGPGGVIFDPQGNMYGVTGSGGKYGGGTVFELTSNGDGTWTETILHSFGNLHPNVGVNGLIRDKDGNLYGTTYADGLYDAGCAFELSPKEGGRWEYTVLHNFGHGEDGSNPTGDLVMDAAGNLYGTTLSGGTYREGTAFEIIP